MKRLILFTWLLLMAIAVTRSVLAQAQCGPLPSKILEAKYGMLTQEVEFRVVPGSPSKNTLPSQMEVEFTGNQSCINPSTDPNQGTLWWEVTTINGKEGWVAETYGNLYLLEPAFLESNEVIRYYQVGNQQLCIASATGTEADWRTRWGVPYQSHLIEVPACLPIESKPLEVHFRGIDVTGDMFGADKRGKVWQVDMSNAIGVVSQEHWTDTTQWQFIVGNCDISVCAELRPTLTPVPTATTTVTPTG